MAKNFKAGYPSKVIWRMVRKNEDIQDRLMPSIDTCFTDPNNDDIINVTYLKTKRMSVGDVIKELEQIPDKTLPVTLPFSHEHNKPVGQILNYQGTVTPLPLMYSTAAVKMTKAEYDQYVIDRCALADICESKAIQCIEKAVNLVTTYEGEYELPMTIHVASNRFGFGGIPLTQPSIDAIKRFVQEAMDDGPDINVLKVEIDDMFTAYAKRWGFNMVFKITISEK